MLKTLDDSVCKDAKESKRSIFGIGFDNSKVGTLVNMKGARTIGETLIGVRDNGSCWDLRLVNLFMPTHLALVGPSILTSINKHMLGLYGFTLKL